MPWFRIETRTKASAPPSAEVPPRAEPPRAEPPRAARRERETRKSPLPALAAGALFGLAAIAGLSAYLLSRSPGASAGQSLPAPVAAVAVASPTAFSRDYAPAAIIAYVNGQPYTMAQLETSVRIARVLGTFTGDDVPADTAPEMREFLVKMLRRQIDILLFQQAMAQEKITPPGGAVDDLKSGFLKQTGATEERLAARMAEEGVTVEQLDAWFAEGRAVNFYIQNTLMPGKDPAERETTVRAWLDGRWETGQIDINFYDPETPSP